MFPSTLTRMICLAVRSRVGHLIATTDAVRAVTVIPSCDILFTSTFTNKTTFQSEYLSASHGQDGEGWEKAFQKGLHFTKIC